MTDDDDNGDNGQWKTEKCGTCGYNSHNSKPNWASSHLCVINADHPACPDWVSKEDTQD